MLIHRKLKGTEIEIEVNLYREVKIPTVSTFSRSGDCVRTRCIEAKLCRQASSSVEERPSHSHGLLEVMALQDSCVIPRFLLPLPA